MTSIVMLLGWPLLVAFEWADDAPATSTRDGLWTDDEPADHVLPMHEELAS